MPQTGETRHKDQVGARPAVTGVTIRQVRAWARSIDPTTPARGALPADVIHAWNAAHPDQPYPGRDWPGRWSDPDAARRGAHASHTSRRAVAS